MTTYIKVVATLLILSIVMLAGFRFYQGRYGHSSNISRDAEMQVGEKAIAQLEEVDSIRAQRESEYVDDFDSRFSVGGNQASQNSTNGTSGGNKQTSIPSQYDIRVRSTGDSTTGSSNKTKSDTSTTKVVSGSSAPQQSVTPSSSSGLSVQAPITVKKKKTLEEQLAELNALRTEYNKNRATTSTTSLQEQIDSIEAIRQSRTSTTTL